MKKDKNKIIIYQSKSGALELRGDPAKETIWATQAQISDIFGAERSVVTKHIRNIFKDKELDSHSACAKFAHTARDGKIYQVQCYGLDVILQDPASRPRRAENLSEGVSHARHGCDRLIQR